MIKVDKNTMEVTGTYDELVDNLQFFFFNSFNGEKIDNPIVEELFSFESYLRMMYTIASIKQEKFVKFLKANQEVLKNIQDGNFKLIYRDKIEGDEDE